MVEQRSWCMAVVAVFSVPIPQLNMEAVVLVDGNPPDVETVGDILAVGTEEDIPVDVDVVLLGGTVEAVEGILG